MYCNAVLFRFSNSFKGFSFVIALLFMFHFRKMLYFYFPTDGGPLVPYSLPCVRELLRFLISLISPVDSHNTDVMIHMGLSLLTIALESGADHMSTFKSLLALIKDDLCKNLFFVRFQILYISVT